MYPVYRLVKIKGVPPQLVWDVMNLLPRLVLRVRVERFDLTSLEVAVATRRQDPVEPCLLVLVSRRCEGGSRELFGVEAIWWFLRRVGTNWKRTLYGFCPWVSLA